MITIIDYGVGNLFSLKSSFAALGAEVQVTSDPEAILNASKIILPGEIPGMGESGGLLSMVSHRVGHD